MHGGNSVKKNYIQILKFNYIQRLISYRAVNNIFFEKYFSIIFLTPLWLPCCNILACLPMKILYALCSRALKVYCPYLLCEEWTA
jgi:hypothetical protein